MEREPSAVSTRAITDHAGVTAPTLYHHFGDKDSLLETSAEDHFTKAVQEHRAHASQAPITAIENAWDMIVDYGRAYPQLFDRLFGATHRGQPGVPIAEHLFVPPLTELAQNGAFVAPMEAAKRSLLAANIGAALMVMATPEDEVATDISRSSREGILRSFLKENEGSEEEWSTYVSAAVALSSALKTAEKKTDSTPPQLSGEEYALFLQWLERLAANPQH